ncbi:MAG: GtrA family protein [Anaerolineales bacterium]|nr:GtrA family protein [Anaerolineales bacterium]
MKLSSIVTDEREKERFLKFALVGTFGAGVDFGTFHLLVSVLGMNAVLASVLSFTAAISSNFIWNRFWTYPDSRSKPFHHQLTTFFLVNIVGLGIRTPIFASLEGPLRQLFEGFEILPFWLVTADRLGYTFALGVAVVVVMFWNFYVNRYWTYNDVD